MPRAQAATRGVLLQGLEPALRLLHPYMPFVTEEIWQQLPAHGRGADHGAVAGRPASRDEEAERQMETVFAAIRFVRNARAELKLDPMRHLPLVAVTSDHAALLREQAVTSPRWRGRISAWRKRCRRRPPRHCTSPYPVSSCTCRWRA